MHDFSDDTPIDPLNEFDPIRLEYRESVEVIQEAERYLQASEHPIRTAFKKYGAIVLESLAKSGTTLGIYRPPKSV